jgi:hypothetical protein
MNNRLRAIAAVLACGALLLAGCQDKHDPVKPTVASAQR